MVDQDANRLDKVFAAVADPTRRSILQRLAGGEATISELAQPLRMTLEGASKHVRVLHRAGLVHRRRVGRSHVVRLNAGPLAEATAWMERYRVFWSSALDDLATYVEAEVAEGESPSTAGENHAHDQVP